MHIIPGRPRAVTLFSCSGEVQHFVSLADAHRQLGLRWIGNNVRAEFRTFLHTTWRTTDERIHYSRPSAGGVLYAERQYMTAQFIMRDDFGVAVTSVDFESPKRAPRTWGWTYYTRFWNGEGPVPGIRKSRGGYHYCRRVRHMNARRGAETFACEGEVPPRFARQVHSLPQPYDDYMVAARQDRSWKRHRNTQWKAKRAA